MASVVKQVQSGRIATDPNYVQRYGDWVSDTNPPDSTADEPVPAVPVTAEPVPVVSEETGYTPDGVPTFDYARERIETRLGTAQGSAELAADIPEGRSVQEQYEARQKAAAERLAQIRESMRGDEPTEP